MNTKDELSRELREAMTAVALEMGDRPDADRPMPAQMVGAGLGVLLVHIANLLERVEALERRAGVT